MRFLKANELIALYVSQCAPAHVARLMRVHAREFVCIACTGMQTYGHKEGYSSWI